MGNHSSESEPFAFEDLGKEISLLVDVPETNLRPDFSAILMQEKLKYFQLIQNNINVQKEIFLNNCKKINDIIDEQFNRIVALLRSRQRALKSELTKEAKEKFAIWDQQLLSCDNVLQWLKVIENNANLHSVRNFLNTKLTEDLEFIDSGVIKFDLGETKINNSTIALLKPLENLGRIAFNQDLKLISPKFVFGSTGGGEGEFCRPWGVCTDSAGNIFVSDRSNNRIQVFNEIGEFVFSFGKEGSEAGELNRPAGIAVNSKYHIIVCDKDNHRIQIFTYTGRFLNKFGRQGVKDGEFMYPWDVAVNRNCEIAVTDSKNHRVQVFDEFGIIKTVFDWMKFGMSTPKTSLRIIDSPRGVAFRPDGSLLITDFNNHHILMISRNFDRFKTFGYVGEDPGEFFRPQGIACDSLGRFAVADCKNHRVQVFDANDQLIKVFGCQGNGFGQFDCPQGIAFHPNGSIVVVDFSNDRVQIF